MRCGWLVAVCLLDATLCPAQSAPTQEFRQTYHLPAGKNVHIRNILGTVHIIGWDRQDVEVDAIKRANPPAQLASSEVVVTEQAKELCVATRYPAARAKNFKMWFGFALDLCSDPQNINGIDPATFATVDYTVSVPRNTAVVVINEDGDVDIDGTREYVFVDIQKGHLDARDIAGDCKLFGSYSGVKVTLTSLSRDTHIQSAVGPLVVSLAPGISAHVHAYAARAIENDFGWQSRQRGELEGSLGEGKPLMDVLTSGGSIEIRKITPAAQAAAGASKLRRPKTPKK